jgi:hypothetical protein
MLGTMAHFIEQKPRRTQYAFKGFVQSGGDVFREA